MKLPQSYPICAFCSVRLDDGWVTDDYKIGWWRVCEWCFYEIPTIKAKVKQNWLLRQLNANRQFESFEEHELHAAWKLYAEIPKEVWTIFSPTGFHDFFYLLHEKFDKKSE